jgi:hypothetical protein
VSVAPAVLGWCSLCTKGGRVGIAKNLADRVQKWINTLGGKRLVQDETTWHGKWLHKVFMKEIIETMVSIQQAEMGATESTSKSSTASLNALRNKVPAPVLAHFDRLRTRGKKGVSNIRRGVCTECHMKVPMGTLITLAHGKDIQLCGNCGRYLYLPEEEVAISLELLAPKPVRKPAKVKVKAKAAVHAD